MKGKQKRVQSMLKELYQMHQELFGTKYTIGIQLNETSEFNKIIQSFRQLIFTIRHTQQERIKRQNHIITRENKKNYQQSPQAVRINYQIREDIQRAESILTEAVRRQNNEAKKNKKKDKVEKLTPEIIKKRQKVNIHSMHPQVIENCYDLLKDIKQTETGGIYQPPVKYQTLDQIKKQLIGKDYESVREDSINIEEETFFDQANKKDKQIDKNLDDVIEVNERVKNKMKLVNEKEDQVQEKVVKATKKTDILNERVRKDEKDLLEFLKTYRRPNQLCLDITLVFMVLALIGVIINLVRTL